MTSTARTLWVDATAGVAGDMMLGALVDLHDDPDRALSTAGAAVEAVLPNTVELRTATVTRAGMRALKVDVVPLVEDHPHRSWATIRELLVAAELGDATTELALAAFAELATAEGRAHGISPDDVHFHEVGSWDSIADIVGSCRLYAELGRPSVTVGPWELGSGTMRIAHGTVGVPGPAVLELTRGYDVTTDLPHERTTPTGAALLRAWGARSGRLAGRIERTGVGAGTRDDAERANTVRLVLTTAMRAEAGSETLVELAANVDDLDPRLWPGTLQALLDAGALDAWLVPILMKKGRPAHTVHVLARPQLIDELVRTLHSTTTTLGVRRTTVLRDALERRVETVTVSGQTARVKLGIQDGRIATAQPEFDDVAALSRDVGSSERDALEQVRVAAVHAGLTPGTPWPRRP
ncbi:nickel pincer cofactor biosynthesis protein LarC [Flexivirga oryzae]|uniref:Nickel-pincer cofactor biosynthesis protein LarC n=1 Tax=Flexivirga oryzae TaxID=1794944 RepID=A0A839NFB1_9MICO|nr:nickel pincer cofactor biosynthesis protein LarC [Flexivirga oryzae]MBB2894614.1 hypothetical protein [Flexivirga oryzae]